METPKWRATEFFRRRAELSAKSTAFQMSLRGKSVRTAPIPKLVPLIGHREKGRHFQS
jgi:hypothetical protein